MSKSIMQTERECWFCGSPFVVKHHVFFGNGVRQISEREGCWVWLCPVHHNMSDESVHFCKPMDLALKDKCKKAWKQKHQASDEDFIAVFGRGYI